MASRGVNKVIIIGNLGQDPEVRFAPSGTAFANFTVATSETWKDKQSGEQKENTEWHRISIVGKLAEIASEYLKKGSKVYIEGKLQTRKWTNKEGQDQYTTEVVVDGFNGQMQMLDSRQQGQGGGQQNSGYQGQSQQNQGGYNQGQQGGYQQNQGQQNARQQQGGYQTPAQQNQGGYQAPAQQQGGYQQNNGGQQQGGYQNQAQQQGGQANQKVNPQEPNNDFNDDIPF